MHSAEIRTRNVCGRTLFDKGSSTDHSVRLRLSTARLALVADIDMATISCEVLPSACLSVCLSVCLSARISQNHTSKFHQIFCTILPVAVARSFSDCIGISYVLPVLWMTSYFYVMEQICQNQRRRVCFVQFVRWLHHRRSLPSPTASYWLRNAQFLSGYA